MEFEISVPGLVILNFCYSFRSHFVELAFVTFRVFDEDELTSDDFVAQSTACINSLNQGYSHIRLRTLGDIIIPNASLFVHVAVSDQGFINTFF